MAIAFKDLLPSLTGSTPLVLPTVCRMVSQPQNAQTTDNCAYKLIVATSGYTVARNIKNSNTDAPPLFFLPTEDQWYKAAYYSQNLNAGRGGYYLYATKSDDAPGNQIGNEANMANYIDDYSGSYFYCVPQNRFIDPTQNYLTDIGAYVESPSYFGTLDQSVAPYKLIKRFARRFLFCSLWGSREREF